MSSFFKHPYQYFSTTTKNKTKTLHTYVHCLYLHDKRLFIFLCNLFIGNVVERICSTAFLNSHMVSAYWYVTQDRDCSVSQYAFIAELIDLFEWWRLIKSLICQHFNHMLAQNIGQMISGKWINQIWLWVIFTLDCFLAPGSVYIIG